MIKQKYKTKAIIAMVFIVLGLIGYYATVIEDRSDKPTTGDITSFTRDEADSNNISAEAEIDSPASDGPTEDIDSNSYIDIKPEAAYELITDNPEVIVIDVSPNYDDGHLPGAVNYYVGDGSLDEAIPSLDKSGTYLVYCHVDSASIAGAQKLVDAGFSDVYRLDGNYSAWVDAGLPIE